MSSNPDNKVRVIDSATESLALSLVVGDGDAAAVIWPGMGAIHRSFQTINLGAKASTIDLKHHAESAYYVRAGGGVVRDVTSGEQNALVEGSMIHIAGSDVYRFEAGEEGMCLIGGPCPAEPDFYVAASAKRGDK